MASKAVIDAVIARLQANWTATLIVLPNGVSQPPADGSAFVTLQFPTAIANFIAMAGVGSRIFREEGTIRLVVSVPRGDGMDTGLGYCDTLAALFRAVEIPTSLNPVKCRTPSPAIDNDSSDNGAYWILSVSIPYFYDLAA